MKRQFSFTILLVVAFLDYLGIGLVFPIFASFLFDGHTSLFTPKTTDTIRAMWMGILMA